MICTISNLVLVAQNTDELRSFKQVGKPEVFNAHKSLKVNEKKRNDWIRNKVDSFISGQFGADINILTPHVTDLDEFQMISYKINGEGKLVFESGEYFVIYVHSAHEDDEIGDVSLAFSMNKDVYINYGHVCGGIIHFINMSTVIPIKPTDFFSFFISDTDDEKWIKWEHK